MPAASRSPPHSSSTLPRRASKGPSSGWCSRARKNTLPGDTPVLNIDNVGAGTLYYATGEGMLGVIPFRGPLVEAASRLEGASPLVYTLAYFDTLPFARAGYPCLTLIRLDRGIPPHWHWPTDVREHVDDRALADTLTYARALAQTVLRQ